MITMRITRTTPPGDLASGQQGDPVMIITVTGAHDFYRFADHMTRGQVEFAALGYRAFRYLKRRYGRSWLRRASTYFLGRPEAHG